MGGDIKITPNFLGKTPDGLMAICGKTQMDWRPFEIDRKKRNNLFTGVSCKKVSEITGLDPSNTRIVLQIVIKGVDG